MRNEYFTCSCGSPEHTLRFILEPSERGWPAELHTEVYLNQYHGVMKRLWIAIKYALGYKCRYGDFDSFILRKEEAERLRNLLDDYIKDTK